MSSNPPSRYHSSQRIQDGTEYRRSSQQPARRSSGSRPRRSSAGLEPSQPIDAPRTRRKSIPRREMEFHDGEYRQSQRSHKRDTYRDSNAEPMKVRGRDGHTERGSTKTYTQPSVTIRPLQASSVPAYNREMPGGRRTPYADMPITGAEADLARKKSLVRPERRRQDPDEPGYYYKQHAQNMKVMPSTTGRDPLLEESMNLKSEKRSSTQYRSETHKPAAQGAGDKLTRTNTLKSRQDEERERQKKNLQESGSALTIWGAYSHAITFWCPNFLLSCFGKKNREQQRAWREKIGLISVILLVMLFVGFLTFGFTETVCPSGSSNRFRVNQVDTGYMIFHGQAYNFLDSHHPAAIGIPDQSNVLYSPVYGAGKDGSFLFQNVNGACKNIITPAPGSEIVTSSDGDMAWYFPCTLLNQDGSTRPNASYAPPYLGYSCHATTDPLARNQFYGLHASGAVYFTWEDVRNSSRNLIVYGGDVLDLGLLQFLNKSQVNYPAYLDQMQGDSSIRGQDVTWALSSGDNKEIAACLQELVKVGSIEAETIGCIASKVVLYVSLAFILGIVAIKFVLAVMFQWFLCKKYAPAKTSMTGDAKKRNKQIEDWTDDIYRPPPKMTDPGSVTSSDRPSKRSSIFPSTSRFTSPYAMDKSVGRPRPTTMASQHSTARLMPGASGNSMYGYSNRSEATLNYMDGTKRSTSETRASLMESHSTPSKARFSSVLDSEITGPQELIHEAVVPQPPIEWQPFGFPLAHTICLVTAYSEGPEGIRTTLDSIAMTDYPNSHKLIYVICDGLIKGKGEKVSTPEACIGMMKDLAIPPEEVQPFSYVAVASGSKRHNMAKVYCGFYDYGPESVIPVERQQRVPMMVIVKCGTPAEAGTSKPGNRGKRDSQIILMSFLQKVMFDERMTELEYEMFNGIWSITGISPDFYEITLMVDADTKVFPDSLSHMVSAMVKDPDIMGLCGETKIANKKQSWVTMIQVFEYFISHHQAKAFESVFGGVTCLPGCFCMYRIKAPKGGQNYWVPILANPDIVEHYSENVVDTLHKKNLLLLGEDRYLTSLMLKTFPKRKQVFIPQAVCKTTVPDEFKVLLSQRRRWINSTIHNLMELILVRDLCGTFCFSMQFVLFIDLVGTLVLPAAIAFTLYVVARAIVAAVTHTVAPTMSLILLALILGLPGVLIVITAHSLSYVMWLFIYLLSLPIWNFVLPVYAFWHFDDFSWGDTRQAAGETKGADKAGHGGDGEFDSSQITMRRWIDFEQDRRLRGPAPGSRPGSKQRHSSMSGLRGGERRASAHLI